MKTSFRESFARDLRRLRQPEVRARVKQVIEAVERAAELADIPQLRKLQARAMTLWAACSPCSLSVMYTASPKYP